MEKLLPIPLNERAYEELRDVDPLGASALLLASCTRKKRSDGSIYLESTSQNFPVIVTTNGLEMARSNPYLLALPALPPTGTEQDREYFFGTQSRFVQRQTISHLDKRYSIAIKMIEKGDQSHPTGIELLNSFHYLQEAGVTCPDPLLATDEMLVTQWIEGDFPLDEAQFDEFILDLRKITYSLRSKRKIANDMYVDENWKNYRIIDEYAELPIDRYVAIDPLYREKPERLGFSFELPEHRCD